MPDVLPLSEAQIRELVSKFFWDTYGAEATLLGDIDLRIERVAKAVEKLALPVAAAPSPTPISTANVEELIRQLLALEMARDQPGAYWSYPEDGSLKTIPAGVTRVNFFTGEIEFPNGTKETFKDNLQARKLDYIRTLYLESDKDVIIWFDMATAGRIAKVKYFGNVSLRELRIYAAIPTTISLWVCTKPNATQPRVIETTDFKGSKEDPFAVAVDNTQRWLLVDASPRLSVIIANAGPATIYLVNKDTVLWTDGIPLVSGRSLLDTITKDAWYAVTQAGNADVRVMRVIWS